MSSHQEESAVKSEQQMAPTAAAQQQEQQQQQQQQQASSSSCRKKKSDSTSTSFFGDIVDHIDEFVNASYDEHKTCLQKTLNKMFGMSKVVSNGTGTTTTSATVPVENVMSRPATTE